MAMQTDRGVPLSTLAPKFLHTNSTSHTWPFSAIAELIDNAYDPDVNAKQFWIDKTVLKGDECLTFMDNGNGLDKQSMHKMLSFGYSDKVAVNGLEPIGIYGNGFKSGSMRLGKDAIVFSKSTNTSCVGMLSQTYLEKIDAKQIIVPIVCFEEGENNKFTVREEHKASLQDILRYSPFNTQEELLAEINTISSPWSTKKTGTRIIIWNLRRTSLDMAEFDFKKDRYDIRMPSELYDMMNGSYTNTDRATSHTPETLFSLRAYCSILYLKPRMQIMVRGQKVKSQLIAKSLAYIRKDHYKPQVLNGKRIAITFGYNTKSKDQYGIMMYHKNRLIKAYERVGCQLKADHRGVGVIGVIECNFLEPTHNKQSFLESDKYRKTITSVGIKLEEYWHEIRYRKTKENPNSTIPVEDTMKRPDQNWVQCDSCLQWRKLPDGIDCGKLPEKWFCRMNPDPQFRSCQVQEEAEDSDDDQPSYRKTYRDQEKVNKRIHISELKAVEEKKRRESQKPATPPETVRRQLQLIHLKKALHPSTSYLPSTPTTSSTSLQGGATRPDFTPQIVTLSQAAHSPSGSHGLPVISNVCSLSMTPQSAKRQNLVTPPTSKRPRLNGRHSGSPDTPASVNSPGSPFVPVVSDTDTDETDDDLVILETASTPKPQQSVDGKKVKTEKEKSEAPVDMLWECVDDADTSGTNVAGTSCARSTAGGATPSTVSSTTTQTEVPKLKEEKLSQSDERATTSTSGNNNIGQKCHLDPNNVAPIVVKQENHENGLSEFQRGYSSQTTDDPVNLSNIVELQKQQDQLMELMEDTAKERDALKEQVHQLTSKLQSMEGSFSAGVKKEHSHQFTQTEETEEYRSLPEVKQEVGESNLVKKATDNEADSSPGHSEERDVDISLQVESLIEDLDELRKKKDKLLAQVESLQKKKATMVAQCEELEMSLQEDQEEETAALLPRYSSVQPPSEEEGGSTSAGTVSTKDAFESLIELRHNIGRILVKVVPELDLGQVNYQCNVIDEMLEGLVNNQDSFLSLVKTLNANDT